VVALIIHYMWLECGYDPQDLTLPNVLWVDKQVLHIIDLGAGVTEGMYQVESARFILQGKMNEWYILLHAWNNGVGYENVGDLPLESVPPLIQKAMRIECCHRHDSKISARNIGRVW